MPEDRKRQTLPSDRLREVLARLDDVLAEAERLRDEVTRQLDAQHEGQQHLASLGRKRARKAATRAPGGRGRRTGG